MSGDIVIRAEGLGKKYLIGHQSKRERYTSLREVIGRKTRNVLRATSDMMRGRAIVVGDTTEEFWALKDVNFEIKRGEVIGIIGRNGAGKSTLLKILSRITEPTNGRVEIRGRVASLLEVGTGFHPELTGRENIYLNGAILGMARAEIRRKFDEIIAFSGIEKFLDTPVKRYSSGMYVRLAFAVAAHLEPDILVVDEVLAVGDAEFQKKCLGKMGEIAQSRGRTVLFVSHQLGMVVRLCSRAILLSGGSIAMEGRTRDVVDAYVALGNETGGEGLISQQLLDLKPAAITGFSTLSKSDAPTSDYAWDESIKLRTTVKINRFIPGMALGIRILDRQSNLVTTWVTTLGEPLPDEQGKAEYQLLIKSRIIAPGRYVFTVVAWNLSGEVYHIVESVRSILVHDSGSEMAQFSNVNYGVVIIPAEWKRRSAAETAVWPHPAIQQP